MLPPPDVLPDDSFYKDVINNVQHNLQHFLDGRLRSGPAPPQPLSDSSNNCSGANSSSGSGSGSNQQLSLASSGYPTLLTAEQFGEGPETQLQQLLPLAKVARRPHTKHSWKWKWDYVKKFTMVNEGGRLVKKLKQPFMGLRDLSRMDMWTQLTMRQKHELEQQQQRYHHHHQQHYQLQQQQQEEQQLQQLHLLLDRRLLPHIILEQNEQAVIKCEQHDEQQHQQLLPLGASGDDELLPQTFADQSFLSLLQLQPRGSSNIKQQQQQHYLSTAATTTTTTTLVLSGEWARPRLYLCICCGAKFEQRKALEEHKTFRHSHIYATHYELVGRELLAGNLLRHLFLPKRALSRYAAEHKQQQQLQLLLQQHKLEQRCNIAEDESSSNSSAATSSAFAATTTTTNSRGGSSSNHTHSASVSVMEDNDNDNDNDNDSNDIKVSHVPPPSLMLLPSCSPSISSSSQSPASSFSSSCCTKCGRKCNGLMDLYRHMLDCSGDYVWSLAKKRKYRYYCGSKKRRTHACNKSAKHFAQLLRQKQSKKCHVKKQQQDQDGGEHNNDASEESGSNCSNSNSNSNSDSNKTKTPPRQRPSDGE